MTKLKSTPPKKPGRAPGSPRVAGSGRKPGVPNKFTADIKELILAKGKPVELLCAVSRGLRVRVGPQAGPAAEWVYPDLHTRINAARTLLGKVIPDMKATELSGPEGKPLMPDLSMPDKEIARRIALVLRLADGTEGSSGGSGPARHGAGSGDAARGTPSPTGTPSSPPSRGNGAADSAEATPGGPLAAAAIMPSHPEPASNSGESGASPVNFSENFKSEKPKPPTEPLEGEDAYVAGYTIKCREPQRPGLPLSYRIYAANGALLSGSCAGWQGALRWIRHRDPDADLAPEIRSAVADDWDPSRPDQRETPPPRPEVRRDYMNRKR